MSILESLRHANRHGIESSTKLTESEMRQLCLALQQQQWRRKLQICRTFVYSSLAARTP